MNAKISSTFILKSAKTTSKGLIPIYMRVTVDGKRFEISTQKQVGKSKWSTEMRKMKGNSEEARSINEYLTLLSNKLFEAQKQLLLENEVITFETLRNKLFGKEEKAITIVKVFKEHNDKMDKFIGTNYYYNS